MKYLYSLIVFLSISIGLFGQYDEKRILLNQAQSFENTSQYSKAHTLYQDLLKKFPQDYEIIQRYFTSLMKTSSFEMADELLKNSRSFLTEIQILQLKIPLLLKQNEINDAKKASNDYFTKYPGKINDYRLIAQSFENSRIYDFAEELYLNARKTANDPYLYSFELATNYHVSGNYPASITESLKYLDKNRNYYFFMLSRFKEILTINPKMIETIKKECELSEIPEFIELYAQCLVQTKDFENALLMYTKLPLELISRFADEQFSLGHLDLAMKAYETSISKSTDPLKISEFKFKQAQILINKKQYSESKTLLEMIINDPALKDKRNLYKTKVNKEARELLAWISIILNDSEDKVISFYSEAQKFSWNQLENKTIDFKKAYYFIMSEKYDKAFQLIKDVTKNEESGSQILAQSFYYQYLIFLMSEDSRADSMMTEYIIYFPENDQINDMMFLSLFVSSIAKENRKMFFEAYRKKNLMQNESAILLLIEMIKQKADDEIVLLLSDWLLDENRIEEAKKYYSLPFSNQVYQEFAKLRLSSLAEQKEEQRNLITDYLKNTPNSCFSPSFRSLLQKSQLN